MPKTTIAAVNGVAAGAGCGLALACDLVVASSRASFVQAFVKLGLHPDFGCAWILPRLIGPARARELLFTGRAIDASEAQSMGLINRVVAHDELMPHVATLAKEVAAGPARALALTKATLNAVENLDLVATIDLEMANQRICIRSSDFAEGARAFLEKRPPSFSQSEVVDRS
jgi:2-(1,2-epoxy-1,2-dihydrophenyl)acetyl-CoA isomerase